MELGEPIKFNERKRIYDDVFMNVEYTEATWSVRQSVRDLYQNHLDAQMEININLAVEKLCVTLNIDEALLLKDQDFRNLIYLYFGVRDSGNELAETEIVEEIIRKCQSVGGNDVLIEDTILANIETLELVLPKREYLVADENTGDRVWVSEKSLSRLPDNANRNTFKQKILGVKITDTGSGYDSRFKSIFNPTKQDSPEQAGKFGEGAKISDAYLKKHGYRVVSRSSYVFRDETGTHNMIWKARPLVEEGRLVVKGVRVEVNQKIETGSSTEILFPEDQSVSENLLWDPRAVTPGGQEILWLENKDNKKIHYPSFKDNPFMLGIVTSSKRVDNYVQGIKVSPNQESSQLYFNYVSWNKKSLDSRDRNKFSDFQIREVENLWIRAFDGDMADLLVRTMDQNGYPRGREIEIAKRMLSDSGFKFDLSEDQINHWRQNYFDAFKKHFNYKKEGKFLILDRVDKLPFEDIQLLKQLKQEGYQVVEFNGLQLGDAVRRKFLGPNTKTLEEVAQGLTKQTEKHLTPDQKKRLETVKNAVESSREELFMLLGNTVGTTLTRSIRNIEPVYVFDSTFGTEVFGRTYNHKRQAFDLVINVDSFISSSDKVGVTRLLQTYLLASENQQQSSNFRETQFLIDEILEICAATAISENLIDFEYFSPFNINEYLKGKINRETTRVEQESQLFESLSNKDVPYKVLKEVAEFINANPSSDLLEIAARNVFVDGGKVSRVYLDESSGKWTAECRDLSSLSVIGESRGVKVRRFDNFVIATIPPFKQLSVADQVIFNHDEKLYRSNPANALRLEVEAESGLKFNHRMAFLHVSTINDAESLNLFASEFARLTHHGDGERPPQTTRLESGIIKTSLSTEYGKDNWDDPMRFFEDIAQNHIDAGHLEMKFLVKSEFGEMRWVAPFDVNENDTLLGVDFADNGSGYAPENIRDLGSGDKSSPTKAGKYKEGMKMIFTAASRNQVDLQTSSTCISNGKKISWTAKATMVPELLAKQGELSTVNLTAFDLKIAEGGETAGSSTKILFFDTESEFYRKCMKVIDPRLGGKHKGLARYVRKLRTVEDQEVNVGPVTILKDEDERGKIYENGLLVADVSPQRDSFFFGGYDLPSVTSTRERNDIDSGRFGDYLKFYLYHLENEGQIRDVLQFLNDTNIYTEVNERMDQFRDLRATMSRVGVEYMPSSGRFKRLSREIMGNRFTSNLNSSDLPSILNQRDLLRVNNMTRHNSFLNHFLPTAKNITDGIRSDQVSINSSVKKRVHKIVDELTRQLLEAEKDGKLLNRPLRTEILRMFKNPDSRDKRVNFTRIEGTHYGRAFRKQLTIEINESALESAFRLPGTVVHELTHLWNADSDNQPEFMADMLAAAFYLYSRSRPV